MQPKSSKPTMLYDSDCGFCMYWVKQWEKRTRGHVLYVPYQQALAQFPQVTEAECREAVQLIIPDGTVFRAAHAVFRALACAPMYRALLWLYEHFPPFAYISEATYQLVARHRTALTRGA